MGRLKTIHQFLTVIFETDYEMRVLQENHNSFTASQSATDIAFGVIQTS